MPRVAPTLYEFVGLDDGEYLKVAEAVLPDLRPHGLPARQPRPRPHQGARRQGRHGPLPRDGRRGARRATGSPSATSTSTACASTSTRRRWHPRARGLRLAERRPLGVRALRQRQRPGAAPGRLQHDPREGHPRRPVARAAARDRGDHAPLLRRLHAHDRAPELPAALGARRDRLRGLAGARRARPRRRRPGQGHRRRLVPGHRLVQARHHVVDGPQRGAPAAPRGDADHRPADAGAPHQDERLPERLQPAPHREHRLLRRLDQGRRAHDPGVRRAHRRQLRGRRHRLRDAPEGAPALQAHPRRRRALAALV